MMPEELLKLACERLRKGPEDVNLSQAKTWAAELSKMTPDQQLFAKKAMNDIFFEGQMGTLKRNLVQINNDNWTQSHSFTLSSTISDQSATFLPYSYCTAVGETVPQQVDSRILWPITSRALLLNKHYSLIQTDNNLVFVVIPSVR